MPSNRGLKRLASTLLNKLGLLAHIQLVRRSPLGARGWFRSFRRGRAEDSEGNPIPWLSYSAIDFLAPRIARTMSVFEFGAGNGTLWWAARAAKIVAVEHDATWCARLGPLLPANATLLHASLQDGDRYAQSAAEAGVLFDVIVVDGEERVACARASVPALKPAGVIVWDDMDRVQYAEGRDHLHALGFRSIVFSGIGPAAAGDHGTTVFYRRENCLGI